MFKKLANPDGWFVRCGTIFFDMVVASVLFVVTSLPMITLGPAFAALYGVTVQNIFGDRGSLVKNYFRLFRENFLNAMCFMLFFMFFLAGGLLIGHAVEVSGGETSLLSMVLRVLIIPIGAAFPFGLSLLLHFDNTFLNTLKNAFIFAYTPPLHFFIAVALVAALALCVLLCLAIPSFLLILPAAWCAIASIPVEKYMKPYLSEKRED